MNQLLLKKMDCFKRLGQRLWMDSSGFVLSGEYILTTSILAIGMVVGVVTFRNQIMQEYGDLSEAMESLDQSYNYKLTIPDPNDPNEKIEIANVVFDENNYTLPEPPTSPAPTGESDGGDPPAGIEYQNPIGEQ